MSPRRILQAAVRQKSFRTEPAHVVIHKPDHMSFGPAEASRRNSRELYDVNVLSTQRVNRAALPQLRKQGRGSSYGYRERHAWPNAAVPLAYFARRPPMDSLAVSYASELTRWVSETSIVVPVRSRKDQPLRARRRAIRRGARCRVQRRTLQSRTGDALKGPRASSCRCRRGSVAEAIVKVVDAPFGKRPFRVHVDSLQDGA